MSAVHHQKLFSLDDYRYLKNQLDQRMSKNQKKTKIYTYVGTTRVKDEEDEKIEIQEEERKKYDDIYEDFIANIVNIVNLRNYMDRKPIEGYSQVQLLGVALNESANKVTKTLNKPKNPKEGVYIYTIEKEASKLKDLIKNVIEKESFFSVKEDEYYPYNSDGITIRGGKRKTKKSKKSKKPKKSRKSRRKSSKKSTRRQK